MGLDKIVIFLVTENWTWNDEPNVKRTTKPNLARNSALVSLSKHQSTKRILTPCAACRQTTFKNTKKRSFKNNAFPTTSDTPINSTATSHSRHHPDSKMSTTLILHPLERVGWKRLKLLQFKMKTTSKTYQISIFAFKTRDQFGLPCILSLWLIWCDEW